jgi:hypothetical protein
MAGLVAPLVPVLALMYAVMARVGNLEVAIVTTIRDNDDLTMAIRSCGGTASCLSTAQAYFLLTRRFLS